MKILAIFGGTILGLLVVAVIGYFVLKWFIDQLPH